MQIHGVVPQAPFVGELPQEVTCVGIPTSAGVLTAAFIDEAVASPRGHLTARGATASSHDRPTARLQ